MLVLNAEGVAKWFRGFENLGIRSNYAYADSDGLFFTHPEAACIDLEYPPKLERLPVFAHCLATIGYEDQHFDGALIWRTNWSVWNLFDEGVGYRVIERINTGAGQPNAIDAAPGHRFRADELPDAIGMLLQPMIFAWDCYYLPI